MNLPTNNGENLKISIEVSLGCFVWFSDSNERRRVAIKCETVEEQRKLNSFTNFQHNSIITFSNIFKQNGQIFMASTLKMNLGTCKNLLNSTYIEGFPEPVIKIIAKNVLKGLMFLHSNGIIHRGVCAQNILLDTEGEIRLAITQNVIKIKDCPRWIGQLNRVHSFAGLEDSFVWLAPEVLRQDLNGYGIESDIYSFGIFICELSNGIAPFAEMEPLRILYEKLRGTTPFLMDSQTSENEISDREFSPDLHELVNESLIHDYEQRPSAHEFLEKYKNTLFIEQINKEIIKKYLPLTNILL